MQLADVVGGRRHSDHPGTVAGRTRCSEAVQEEVGQEEVPQVVEAKMLFESIFCRPLRDHHHASWETHHVCQENEREGGVENGELMAYDVTANGSWGTVGGCAQVIWTLVNFYKNNADPLLASELPYVGMPSLILADFFFKETGYWKGRETASIAALPR